MVSKKSIHTLADTAQDGPSVCVITASHVACTGGIHATLCLAQCIHKPSSTALIPACSRCKVGTWCRCTALGCGASAYTSTHTHTHEAVKRIVVAHSRQSAIRTGLHDICKAEQVSNALRPATAAVELGAYCCSRHSGSSKCHCHHSELCSQHP